MTYNLDKLKTKGLSTDNFTLRVIDYGLLQIVRCNQPDCVGALCPHCGSKVLEDNKKKKPKGSKPEYIPNKVKNKGKDK